MQEKAQAQLASFFATGISNGKAHPVVIGELACETGYLIELAKRREPTALPTVSNDLETMAR